MSYSLQNSITWSGAYIQYNPVTAAANNEPAVSIASLIQSTILNPPFCWSWNRLEDSSLITAQGTQDYTVDLTNFGFLEKCSMQGATSITNVAGNGTTATMTIATPFRDVQVGSAVMISGLSHTAFNGTFVLTALTPTSFSFSSSTSQSSASDSGTAVGGEIFELKDIYNTNALGRSSFQQRPNALSIIANTPGTSIKARFMGVPNTPYLTTLTYQQLATPFTSPTQLWSMPDSMIDVYNNLFLSEMFAVSDNPQEGQVYRQRGVAALLAKAEGLTSMQRDAFAQQWLARGAESAASLARVQQGAQARGV